MKTPAIRNVTCLHLAAGRFATVEHETGSATVQLAADCTLTAGLLAASDAELAKARECHRRASLYRAAALDEIKRKGLPIPAEMTIA